MVVRIVKWIASIVAILIIVVTAVVSISAAFSLDRNYTYTLQAESLPSLPTETDADLVKINVNGFSFRARIAGNNQSGPTVILLHGFPVTSAMWIPLIEPLASAGYRVIAFDQRGYSPGARPEEAAAYEISNLVSDVFAVADSIGAEQFHLVGHDWGSAVGWGAVMQQPQRILSWTGVSIAHPAAFAESLENDPDQQSRSGYFALFTMPLVPERLFTFNRQMVLKALYTNMPEASQEEYLSMFAEPGALTASLNWYRQMGAALGLATEVDNDIYTPSLFIWGNNDPSAGRAAVVGQEKFMKGPYQLLELDGDHWLVNSHSDSIIPVLLKHLDDNSI